MAEMMDEPNKIRVIAADDSEFMREAYKSLFQDQEEIEIVGTASDGEEAVILAEVLQPQVAILDIQMPKMNGLEAAKQMESINPGMGLVVISSFDNTQYILEFLRDRPVGKGYLLKASLGAVNDFVRTIKAVAKGWTVLDPQIARKLLEYHAARASSFLAPLNDLQREVFLRIVEGYEDEDILESGSLAPEGVDAQVNEIYERIGLSRDGQHQRRVEAVLAFLSQTMQGR